MNNALSKVVFTRILLFTFYFFLLFTSSYAGGPGTAAGAFLKIGVGAKSVAMGEASTAVANDASAIYWNPAAVSKLSQKEISLMHNVWLAGINHDFLGYVHPFSRFNFGIAVILLTMEPIPLTTMETTWLTTENFTANSNAVLLNFSRKEKYFLWGLNLKFVQEKIYNYSASAYAVDLGALYYWQKFGLDLGLSVRNVGTQMKFIEESDPLPLEVRLGASHYLLKKKLMIGFDISQPIDNKTGLHLGLQYQLVNFLLLRLGYKYKFGGNDIEGTGLSAGIGVNWKMLSFDYAFVPFGTLGDTHRISMSFRFGKVL